ncbi:MAG: hypothetical protein KBG15_05525 [Kofleriaceae bacterium]|nr:hypothetical protein [Kofleriaceae bacterium]
MRISSVSFVSLLVVAAVGCDKSDGASSVDQSAAELAVDSSDSGQTEGAVMSSLMEGTEVQAGLAAPTDEDVAQRILDRAKARYLPAPCLTATRTGAAVNLVLNGCTGPRGLRTLTGTINVIGSVTAAGDFQAVATAQGLMVNASVMDINSTAIYAPSAKTLSVTTAGAGIGPLGNEISRTGAYTVAWTATCATVAGAWSTTVGDAARSTTVQMQRCKDSCPIGSVVHTGRLGRTVTVTFDGTAVASWVSSKGGAGTIDLPCGQ